MKEKIKLGYIGCGRRGTGVMRNSFVHMKDVEVVKICDFNEKAMDAACKLFKEQNKPEPIKTKNADDIINGPEIDAIIIMTAWQGRSELAIKSMRAGKYTAIEVGVAYDISECYDLVKAYEETGVPLMMLENCCYGRLEMMGYNVAEQGLLGELIHCDGGYHHYLPDDELFMTVSGIENPISHYRLTDYIYRNCETYPTHEFGPIAKTFGINRGNKMLTLICTPKVRHFWRCISFLTMNLYINLLLKTLQLRYSIGAKHLRERGAKKWMLQKNNFCTIFCKQGIFPW